MGINKLKADMLIIAGKGLASSGEDECDNRMFAVWLCTVLPQGWGPVKYRRIDSKKVETDASTS